MSLESENKPRSAHVPNPWKDLAAGYIAGVANIISGQPFDICKVRIQSKGSGTFLSTFKDVVNNEGVLALWKGSVFPLLTFGVCNAILFAVNEKCKFWFKETLNTQKLSPVHFFISGAAAGVANTIISCPMEHMRIRMQIQDAKYKVYNNSFDAAKKIAKQYGAKGVFKGMAVTLLRESTLYGGYFAAYEILRQAYPSDNKLWLLTCGGIAGISGWTFGCIPDNIKSKIQSDSFTEPKYKSALQVYRKSNLKQLTRGLTVIYYRAFPVNACTFLTFELAVNSLYGHKH